MKPLAARWLKFNFVGALGIGVQLGALALLAKVFGVPVLIATPIAVETAVLHNFVWHERYTWRDRTVKGSVWGRLLRFHAGNGLISIGGNVVFMALFYSLLHLPLLIANGCSIAACSLLNFAASEWFVFRR